MGRYGIIFACAQKNVGPAGVTIVIIRDDLLAKAPKDLPSLLNYPALAENNSLLNTPPTFAIYMVKLVTDWLVRNIGGLEKMVEINRRKAGMLYDVIDGSGGFYLPHAETASRSIMNVPFKLADTSREEAFLKSTRPRAGWWTQGAPLGRRLPGVDLQRHARGGRADVTRIICWISRKGRTLSRLWSFNPEPTATASAWSRTVAVGSGLTERTRCQFISLASSKCS